MYKTLKGLRLITTRSQECPENFCLADRRIYSLLAYRARLNRAASKREIATEAIVDSRTAGDRLDFLGQHNLVTQAGSKWQAIEPSKSTLSWFPKNSKASNVIHWFDEYCYMKLLLPRRGAKCGAKRFTITHAHMYSMLSSLSRKGNGLIRACDTGRLCKMLNGIDPKTVRSAMKLLESIDLCKAWKHDGHQWIRVQKIQAEHLHLFEPREKARNEGEGQSKSNGRRIEFDLAKHQEIFDECKRTGIPNELACSIVKASAAIGLEVDRFEGYLAQAMKEHQTNRLKGKVRVPHPGNLLLYKLRQAGDFEDELSEATLRQASKSNDGAATTSIQVQKRQATSGYYHRIRGELARTREFLVEKFGHTPSTVDVAEAIEDRRLHRWLSCGRVHPLFVWLDPSVEQAIGDQDVAEVFQQCVAGCLRPGEDLKAIYNEVFSVAEEVTHSTEAKSEDLSDADVLAQVFGELTSETEVLTGDEESWALEYGEPHSSPT